MDMEVHHLNVSIEMNDDKNIKVISPLSIKIYTQNYEDCCLKKFCCNIYEFICLQCLKVKKICKKLFKKKEERYNW